MLLLTVRKRILLWPSTAAYSPITEASMRVLLLFVAGTFARSVCSFAGRGFGFSDSVGCTNRGFDCSLAFTSPSPTASGCSSFFELSGNSSATTQFEGSMVVATGGAGSTAGPNRTPQCSQVVRSFESCLHVGHCILETLR